MPAEFRGDRRVGGYGENPGGIAARVFPDCCGEFVAVHPRHPQVGQDQVRAEAFEFLQRLRTGGSRFHLEIQLGRHGRQDFAVQCDVVDHEEPEPGG